MKRDCKYTCIFGGGSVRGLAYIGAVKALQEFNIKYDTIAGSSVGALMAALLAVGYNYQEIKSLITDVNFELFRDIHFGLGKGFAISKGQIFTDWVREILEKKFYENNYSKGQNKPLTFKDLDIDLVIFSTILVDFKCKEFSKMETPDFEIAQAVRISCSMPGLMTPVEIDGKNIIDGDVLKCTPTWKLSDNLNINRNRVLEFRLEGEYQKVENNALDYINAIYSCITSVCTDFIIDTYNQNDDYNYIKINTGNVLLVNFNMSKEQKEEIMNLGYQQTFKYLSKELLKKQEKVSNAYEEIIKPLNKLFPFIVSNNVRTSKMYLGEIFIELANYKDIISPNIFNGIQNFKEKFLISEQGTTWFGNPKFKNKKELLKHLSGLINDIDLKIEELNS